VFSDRWIVTGRLVVVSPLHVGTGDTTRYAHVKGKDGEGGNAGTPEVARIARGDGGRPIIPASTLKGLLRRIAETIPSVEVASLFGEIKDDGSGAMGRLLPRTATANALADASKMPYANESADGKPIGRGVFVAARTSVDAVTGAAAKNKLFFLETVAAGAEFNLELVLLAHASATVDPGSLIAGLMQTLDCLCVSEGMPVGRGGRAGGGRIRLVKDSVEVLFRELNDQGDLVERDETKQHWPAKTMGRSASVQDLSSIRLRCDGPFLVADSSWDPEAERRRQGENADMSGVAQLVGQKVADRFPLLLGDSVMGALRARARWLWARHKLTTGASDEQLAGVDRPAFDNSFHVRQRSEIRTLTPVERLFGAAGFKGLLEIVELSIADPDSIEEIDLTSVKLDRFSGAPFDNALFKTQAFLGVTVDLRLGLVTRAGASNPSGAKPCRIVPCADDTELAEKLIADIESNGLMLGHGVNKGFGWFLPLGKEI
jgi:CRISPR/Cas system CSM-associated protein Csm3 (group 7 of RAMP superfamily)